VKNNSREVIHLEIKDNSYNSGVKNISVRRKRTARVILDVSKSYGWYDFSLKINGDDLFEKRYSGRVETGKPGKTDPLMGGMM
jgi:phospholipase C